jgi:hypothetical protein
MKSHVDPRSNDARDERAMASGFARRRGQLTNSIRDQTRGGRCGCSGTNSLKRREIEDSNAGKSGDSGSLTAAGMPEKK